MKTIKSLLILAAVSVGAATVSCTKEEIPAAVQEPRIITISLGIEQPTDEAATKTQLGEYDAGVYPINWTVGDAVALSEMIGGSYTKYTLIDTDENDETMGSFSGDTVAGSVKAFYPYEDIVSASPEVFNVNIPAVQTYSGETSFGEDAMPMYAVMSSCNDRVRMRPLMSVLKIVLTGDCTVKRIIVSNPDVKLSGSATVTYSNNSSASLAFSKNGANNYVELFCPEGVSLKDGCVTFHIVVPATTSTSKYTVRVVTDSCKVMTRKITPGDPFSAGKIKHLTKVLSVVPGANVQYVDGTFLGDAVTVGGYTWAPVNCGYDSLNYKYGKLYQWGRKYGLGYTGDDTTPSFAACWTGTNGNEDYNTFYRTGSSKYTSDWIKTGDNKYWNAGSSDEPQKSSFDPCPDGWRVPSKVELDGLKGEVSSWTEEGGPSSDQKGRLLGTSPSQIFLPAAGCIDSNSSYKNRGVQGYYWSSITTETHKKFRLSVISSKVSVGSSYRAAACSVRCVKE